MFSREFLEEDCNGVITIKEEVDDENGKIAAALVEAIIEQESNEAGGVQQQRILTSNIALGSLLKYDTPLSLKKDSSTEEPRDGTPVPLGVTGHAETSTPLEEAGEDGLQQGSSSAGGAASGSTASAAAKKGMQQVIDMILPPLLWEQGGELWMQQVIVVIKEKSKPNLFQLVSS